MKKSHKSVPDIVIRKLLLIRQNLLEGNVWIDGFLPNSAVVLRSCIWIWMWGTWFKRIQSIKIW